MDGLTLLRPLWLAALVPLALLALWGWPRAPDGGGWQRVMPGPTLAAMQALGALSGRRPGWQRVLAPLAMTALVAGLAGPALPRTDAPVLAQTDAAFIAIDLSPSVSESPAALAAARIAAGALLQGLAGRPVGLIAYAGEAFLVSAPTADTAVLETQIAVMDAATMPSQGSRPADALGLAGKLLEGVRRADVILISDGGGVDAATGAEADRLAAAGVRISTLRLQPLAQGARPEPEAEAALARLTRQGGSARPASDAVALAARLAHAGATRPDPALTALQYRDLGPLLAALASLPLLVMLRRQRR